MNKLLLVMSLSIVLTGCDGFDRTNIFGYESYSHCMLKVLSTQPALDDNIRTYAKTFCKEKFPDQAFDIIDWNDLPESNPTAGLTPDEQAEYNQLREEVEGWIDIKAVKDMTDEELKDEVYALIDEIKKRKGEGIWSIPTEAVQDMTDEELFESTELSKEELRKKYGLEN